MQMVLDCTSRTDEKTSSGPFEPGDCLKVIGSIVDEALALARNASNDVEANSYPSDELHGLSSTLFNLAVDYYTAENEDEAKRWATKAVEAADALGRNRRAEGGDGGALAKSLWERCHRMGWGL